MDQKPLKAIEEWYGKYVPLIQQKLTARALSYVPPVLIIFYDELNKPRTFDYERANTADDGHTDAPKDTLPANSTVFHASVAMEPYEKPFPKIQRELVSQILFKTSGTSITPQVVISLLCCLQKKYPALYENRNKALVPYLSKHFSVNMVISLLTSKKKHLADLGRYVLKQRSMELQQILREKDGNGQRAYDKECVRNALKKVYTSKTLLCPTLYDHHFKPFVAALRTYTLHYLPDNNVFKIAYQEVGR